MKQILQFLTILLTEGRKQAYGWSLPSDFSGDQVGSSLVPVPVYCRPLNTEAAMKVYCDYITIRIENKK